jgi:hypothetical protein
MPSLFATVNGVSVAANYGKMPAQQTYGTDQNFANFGTRNLRFLKITATSDGTTAIDFSATTVYTATTGFTDFAAVVRTLQTIGELYLVGAPGSTGFLIAVAGDTLADGTSVASSSPSYTAIGTAIVAALKANVTSRTGATATVALMTVGASNGVQIA